MPNLLLGAGSDAGGGSATPPAIPTITVAPVVSGTTNSGSTLTTTNGTWTNSPTSYSYQWYSGSTPVGTNANTYLISVGDIGNTIYCAVTASNALYSGVASNSNTVGPVNNGVVLSLDFSQPANSQFFYELRWTAGTSTSTIPSLDFSNPINSEYYFLLRNQG